LTWNSFTASWLNWYGARPEPVRPRAWPKKVLSLFAPSITRLFSVPRWPAKLMSPWRGSFETPGVVRTKSMKLRPFVGRFAMALSFTTEEDWVRVVSTRGVSEVTRTEEVVAMATLSVRSTLPPTETVTSETFAGEKPGSSAPTS
jgi:hypothetical protein